MCVRLKCPNKTTWSRPTWEEPCHYRRIANMCYVGGSLTMYTNLVDQSFAWKGSSLFDSMLCTRAGLLLGPEAFAISEIGARSVSCQAQKSTQNQSLAEPQSLYRINRSYFVIMSFTLSRTLGLSSNTSRWRYLGSTDFVCAPYSAV